MPAFVDVPDPVTGGRGRIRIDRRAGDGDSSAPPLLLLGGMTQTVHSWGAQLRPLARSREVVAWEARGQGTTELATDDCSPARHVADFVALVAALGVRTPVDLCGFSFGGRVCLGIAARHPELVRRVVLSGVALDRGIVGRLIVQGWIATLATGNLEALARVSLPDILGPTWLEHNEGLIEAIVRTTVERNSHAGVEALFEQTLALPADSPWRVEALADELRRPALLLGGALDRLAPPREVAALAARIGARHHVLPDAGHTVPIEAAEAWREHVEAFLDEA